MFTPCLKSNTSDPKLFPPDPELPIEARLVCLEDSALSLLVGDVVGGGGSQDLSLERVEGEPRLSILLGISLLLSQHWIQYEGCLWSAGDPAFATSSWSSRSSTKSTPAHQLLLSLNPLLPTCCSCLSRGMSTWYPISLRA